MRNHNVAQAVFNTLLDRGMYVPVFREEDYPPSYGSSKFMCAAIQYAYANGVLTLADANEAIACIDEYMVELVFGQNASEQEQMMVRGTAMSWAMAQRGISSTPQDRIHLYKNWLERPRYAGRSK